jgi:type I restriction enzyme S subunit
MDAGPGWERKQLSEVADIRSSNVDKKSQSGETRVQLCNYLDVYNNTYITSALEFMEATASNAEIARFAVERGDVIITKDSETPDDIGVPAVAVEDIPNLVCGYHLSLIKPNTEEVDPVFLAAQLAHGRIARYFSLYAHGSTRFGLTAATVSRTPLWLPSLPIQRRIAEIIQTVDEAIRETERVIAKLREVKRGLLHDLLTRGLDAHGHLRDPQAHPEEFKDSPLGRIPREWEIAELDNCLNVKRGFAFHSEDYVERGLLNFRVTNVGQSSQDLGDKKYLPWAFWDQYPDQRLFGGEILLVMVGASTGKLGKVPEEVCPALQNQNTWNLVPTEKTSRDFLWYLLPDAVERHMSMSQGSARDFITQGEFVQTIIAIPSGEEQHRIAAVLDAHDARIRAEEGVLAKRRQVKQGLMDDLLTGRVRV